jgi:hypothetical protein
MFQQLSIFQWVLILWILLLFLKSIVALFDREASDEIIFGILLILGGGLWLMQSYWTGLYLPWIHWLKAFRVEILIAILLIIYGIRLAFKAPWRHIIVIAITIIAFVIVNQLPLPVLSQHSPKSSLSEELGRSTENSNVIEDPLEEGEYLELLMNRGHFTLSTGNITSKILVSDAEKIEQKKKNSFVVSSSRQNEEIILSDKINYLVLESRLGNMQGVFSNPLKKVSAKSNLGDINLSFLETLDEGDFESNMGNVSITFKKEVQTISLKSNAGNIHLLLPKGMNIDTAGLESRLGNINIRNGDGTMGTVSISGLVNLGNITITANQ